MYSPIVQVNRFSVDPACAAQAHGIHLADEPRNLVEIGQFRLIK